MTLEKYSSVENPYRLEILELVERNNEETTPSIQEMTNKWIAEKELGLEEAVEKFYEERTDHILVEQDQGLVKAFFLLEENDEGIKEHVPQHWPHLEVALGVVKQEYRREGLSQKLLEETRELAKQEGLENLVWVTSTANKASQKFAEKNNLEKVAQFSEGRGDSEETVIYASQV